MKPLNLKDFWSNNNIQFSDFDSGLSWTKRHLKPQSMRRVARENYIVDSTEIQKLYKNYLLKQEEIFKTRVINARAMTLKREQNRHNKP